MSIIYMVTKYTTNRETGMKFFFHELEEAKTFYNYLCKQSSASQTIPTIDITYAFDKASELIQSMENVKHSITPSNNDKDQ